VLAHIHEDRGFDEVTGMRWGFTAPRARSTLANPGLDIRQHSLLLLLRHQGSHVGGLVEAGTQANRGCSGAHTVHDLVEDRAMHVQPRTGATHLPRIEENRPGGSA